MHCFKNSSQNLHATLKKIHIAILCDYSGPIKSLLATLTNTCLVSFPDSGTVHTTTEEGLDGRGTRLTAIYNVVMEYYLTLIFLSVGSNH